jgi:1,2-diacylglycerol 3-alpha-glucosyltransferase
VPFWFAPDVVAVVGEPILSEHAQYWGNPGGSVEWPQDPKGPGEPEYGTTGAGTPSNTRVVETRVALLVRAGASQAPRDRHGEGAFVVPPRRVGFFTECYKPIVNGVVASIDALRDGLCAHGVEVTTIAPHFPRFVDDERDVVRVPSLPLPTQTAYRLCVPYLNADDRARLRGIDIVHAHSPFVTGWMGASYARRHRIPLVFTYHTRLDAYAHYAPFDRGATERAMVELTRRYANAADAVVVPTQAMEIRLRELGVHAPIAVVPSAIDVERFAAGRRSTLVRARLGATDAAPLALVVSRLGMEKNVELVLDALPLLPHLRLAVVGEGPHRAALEERARRLGVAERVRFTGTLERADLPDVYASVDAFVFPSTTDTQGLVLAEALAAGLRVVAADSPASRDVLGGAGRIVAPEPAALAAALTESLAAGRDQSAVHLAFSRFSVEMQTRRILELYREVLAARAA